MDKNNNNTRLHYIDGYKGIACLCIMFGHFCGIYKYSNDLSGIRNGFMDVITHIPISIFTSENFWLCFFMLSSGYLCMLSSNNRIDKFHTLLKYCVGRFLRFALPILLSGIIIFMLQDTIGFHNMEMEKIVHNTWLTSGYENRLSFMDILINPFQTLILGTSDFVPPYWCLREILAGSIIIYISSFIVSKIKEQYRIIAFFIIIVIFDVLMVIIVEPLIIAVLLGAMFYYLEKYLCRINVPAIVYWIALFMPIVGFFLNSNSIVISFCFGLSLIGVSNIKPLCREEHSKGLRFLGKISWGVFSYHWPVMCSFGAIVFVSLYGKTNLEFLFAITFIVSIAVTLLLSCLDHWLFLPIANKIISVVKCKI